MKRNLLAVGNDTEPAIIRWRQPLGRMECPYSYRWSVDFGRFGSIRLHHWLRSDDMRAKHDHPGGFLTLVLRGRYLDESIYDVKLPDGSIAWYTRNDHLKPGSVRYRHAEHKHTVIVKPPGCWTLLYFHAPRRNWGFYVPRKLDNGLKFMKSNKYFLTHGHHPCDQP